MGLPNPALRRTKEAILKKYIPILFLLLTLGRESHAAISYEDMRRMALEYCEQLPRLPQYKDMRNIDCNISSRSELEWAGMLDADDKITRRDFTISARLKYGQAGWCMQRRIPFRFISSGDSHYSVELGIDPDFNVPSRCFPQEMR